MSSRQSILLLAGALLLGACATTPIDRPRGAPEPGLYAVSGDSLLAVSGVRLISAGDQSFAASTDLDDVGAMTWDPKTGRFYAVADASSKPRLIAVDPGTGEATSIGPIVAPSLELTLAEGLALDPRSGILYAAGGESDFASNVLLRVDPATGEARLIARIRGTIQDEVDAMTFAGGELYAVDGAGGSTALYRIATDTGKASRASQPFAVTVTDLAFDPAGQRLIGIRGAGGPLVAISLDGTLSEIPDATGALQAIAVIPAAGGAALFEDSFESGDASAWSRPAGQDP